MDFRAWAAAWIAALAMAGAQAATPSISAGNNFNLALGADGSVRSWGDDSSGQLGLGRPLTAFTPVAVSGLTGVSRISSGTEFVVALMRDGTLMAWGNNNLGQLGDGGTTNRTAPAPVLGLSRIVQVSAGDIHTL